MSHFGVYYTMQKLTDILDIQYPIIMAPMFLVSNVAMVKAALDSGITGAIPALNYRTTDELRRAIREIKQHSDKPFGINLIANRSNRKLKEQLKVCVEEKIAFIISSLGNPKTIIKKAHKAGIKVFCDVIDSQYAEKVTNLGADALIAVNNRAGGHAGHKSEVALFRELVAKVEIPIVAAGRVSTKERLKEVINLGYAGASVGTVFIPTHESDVSKEYKQACVDYGEEDIILTTKLSGTPCTVINTPYLQKVGTKQHWFERVLNKNKRLKKFVRLLVFMRGMKSLEKAAFSTTYKTVWCAGESIEEVKEIKSVKDVVKGLIP